MKKAKDNNSPKNPAPPLSNPAEPMPGDPDILLTPPVESKIDIIGFDMEIPLNAQRYNRFKRIDGFEITEHCRSGNIWYEIRNKDNVIMIPVNRVAYLVYSK